MARIVSPLVTLLTVWKSGSFWNVLNSSGVRLSIRSTPPGERIESAIDLGSLM